MESRFKGRALMRAKALCVAGLVLGLERDVARLRAGRGPAGVQPAGRRSRHDVGRRTERAGPAVLRRLSRRCAEDGGAVAGGLRRRASGFDRGGDDGRQAAGPARCRRRTCRVRTRPTLCSASSRRWRGKAAGARSRVSGAGGRAHGGTRPCSRRGDRVPARRATRMTVAAAEHGWCTPSVSSATRTSASLAASRSSTSIWRRHRRTRRSPKTCLRSCGPG